jgi:hypothetical protein
MTTTTSTSGATPLSGQTICKGSEGSTRQRNRTRTVCGSQPDIDRTGHAQGAARRTGRLADRLIFGNTSNPFDQHQPLAISYDVVDSDNCEVKVWDNRDSNGLERTMRLDTSGDELAMTDD